MNRFQIAVFACIQVVSFGALNADDSQVRKAMIDKSVAFLRSSQAEDGSFSSTTGPGVTGLVTSGLLSAGVPESDPIVAKSLRYLEGTRHDDGGLYAPQSRHANYETCLAMMAFSKANSDGRYSEMIQRAEKFVKQQQWDEGEGLTSDDPAYGGAGYGSKSRPDLSNTTFLIDALRSAGCSEEDEAIQRALAFVSKCQNLESPANRTPFAPLINDGGFYYTPAAGGESFAGKDPNGGLRSYASMTYAGLKSMIFAGVEKDDYRVKAAKNFLYNNYSVTSNPGMGTSGLYYYHQTMAKALDALGEREFQTKDGPRDWKSDLIKQLSSTQQSNGSWTNTDARWMEGDPNLVTGYVLLTLSFLK
ncbi:MAG: prenyltransferase/squalene oxidase repeat-containing protein [Pirellula sp.]